MRRVIALLPLALPAGAVACETCRPLVRSGVYGPAFLPTLALLALPLIVLGAIVTLVGVREDAR